MVNEDERQSHVSPHGEFVILWSSLSINEFSVKNSVRGGELLIEAGG